MKSPLEVTLFTEHAKDVTVSKISPSGFYCASGDIGGTVKIWSLDNPEHPVKYEGPMLAGSVLDLQWSPDSQLVVVVGEGRECFGKVFAWDTGSYYSPKLFKFLICTFSLSCTSPLLLNALLQVPPAGKYQDTAKRLSLAICGR